MHHFKLTTVLLAGILFTASVKADSVVILPVMADPNVPAAIAEGLISSATAHLQSRGLDVIKPAGATTVATNAIDDCQGPTCYNSYTRENGVDLGLVLTVFQDGATTSVSVILFEPPAHEYKGGLELASDYGPFTNLLNELLEARSSGPGPWLQVTGAPNKATVLIDGEVVGLLPYRGRVTAGEHIVTVRADGYKESSASVQMESFANFIRTKGISLQPVELRAEREASPSARPASAKTSLFRPLVVSAVIVGATGIALTSVGIWQATRIGECVEETTCRNKWEGGAPTTTLITLGGALVVAGAITGLWAGQHRESLTIQASSSSANLTFRWDF